jgi:hypothetical protein
MPYRSWAIRWLLIAVSAAGLAPVFAAERPAQNPPANYTPEPEVEELIVQASDRDRAISTKAIERLRKYALAAERALNWHMNKESTPAAKARWAAIFAQCCRGKIAYRTTVEDRKSVV